MAWARLQFQIDKRLVLVYCLLYFFWGLGMNWVGTELEIAKFTHWWQVISCYIIYMVPISILLRKFPFHAQYAYGLIAMGLLEFGGYALGTSYAYTNNLLDQFFGERTFALGMALFFALYFPLGNWAAMKLYRVIFRVN